MRLVIAESNAQKLDLIRDAVQLQRFVQGWSSQSLFSQCLAEGNADCYQKMAAFYDNDILIAWAMHYIGNKWYAYGSLEGSIHRFTAKEYRRQGLARLLSYLLIPESMQLVRDKTEEGIPLFLKKRTSTIDTESGHAAYSL